MTLDYVLNASSFVRHFDTITLPEDIVVIRFKSNTYMLDELLVTVEGGGIVKQYKTKSLEVDITEHCKQAGAVKITASIIVSGEAVKTWSIEPIRIKEVRGQYEALPELEALRTEVDTIKMALAELVKSNNL